MTAVNRVQPADPADAVAHFAARLAFETDVSDVHTDLEAGVPDLVVVDSRSRESWDQGHVPGALHLPTAEIAARAGAEVPLSSVVVTYCWGPGCNGATRAAHEFAKRGYRVKEMIGGFEYWAREGLPVERADGVARGAVDLLVAPAGMACAC
ncbi:rhodanese-like domain-containing protein [Actinokineospora fastidiosa]|uniref:Sulfurtransferase n=1 Tax=Actinokineospora fastidiosa TaxID=1816 RepID=A0A918GKB3_9PSEU|nr:rhodanese-like domain-containing protein [Actinokineospora fastidiosa]GGS43549.1 sulfurtransferase [Actinokineospora fastidiosa]